MRRGEVRRALALLGRPQPQERLAGLGGWVEPCCLDLLGLVVNHLLIVYASVLSRPTAIDVDRQTDRQTHIQTDRQTDRPTDRHRHTQDRSVHTGYRVKHWAYARG